MADIIKQYKKVKALLGDGRDLQLSDEDALRYQNVLFLLEERGYLLNIKADGTNWYRQMADFHGFEEWLREETKESRQLSRREWMIGIVCAVVGAVIGLIPYIVTLFGK